MTNLLKVAKLMNDKIKSIEEFRNSLEQLAINKATALSEYEKQLAKTIIQLKNGGEVEVDGLIYKDPPITLTEKIARGACWKESLEKERAEGRYKACITNISALEAQLNGYQSINRYLAETES